MKLGIRDKGGDKNFMVTFETKTEKETTAYNDAVCTVLKEAGLNPFHQIGATFRGPNEPGYHGWEVWKEISKEELQILLPEIKRRAQEFLESWNN